MRCATLALVLACGCSIESPPPSVRTVPLGNAGFVPEPPLGSAGTAGAAGTGGTAGSAGALHVPLFESDAASAVRARPISGGSLFVTRDGTTAVAADPDRDEIYLVDLASRGVRTVPAESGDDRAEP